MTIKSLPVNIDKRVFYINRIGASAELDIYLTDEINELLSISYSMNEITAVLNRNCSSPMGNFEMFFTLVDESGHMVERNQYNNIDKNNISKYNLTIELSLNGFVFAEFNY